jgi:hypothetical protein
MVVSLDRQWWLVAPECGDPGGVIGVKIVGPETRLEVSLSGDVSVDITDDVEVPPLLLARWWVGVAGAGVTVTWVLDTWAEVRWAWCEAARCTGEDIPAGGRIVHGGFSYRATYSGC